MPFFFYSFFLNITWKDGTFIGFGWAINREKRYQVKKSNSWIWTLSIDITIFGIWWLASLLNLLISNRENECQSHRKWNSWTNHQMHLNDYLFSLTTEEHCKRIAHNIEELWQFPHVIGDWKLAVAEVPARSSTLYHDCKWTFSIALSAICRCH